MQKISTLMGIIIIGAIAVIAIGGIFTYQYIFFQKPVACTEEAKVCPDGSSVGRTGPNCEFASCPIENAKLLTEDEKTRLLLKEQSCLDSGGKIKIWISSSFCENVIGFPYNCSLHYSRTLPPDLFCAPTGESRSINICDCGEKRCFDGNECVYDSYIDVTFPRGNEQLVVGSTYKIKWTENKVNVDFPSADICLYAFDEQSVRINTKDEYPEKYTCNPSLPNVVRIGSSTFDAGEYEWLISDDIFREFERTPTYYKIVISIYNNGDFISGRSEDSFTIIPK